MGDGRPPRPDPDDKSELVAGPNPEATGISAFTREDPVRIRQERFGKSLHVTSVDRILRELRLSRQKARPQTLWVKLLPEVDQRFRLWDAAKTCPLSALTT